jgi:hypothetical protein
MADPAAVGNARANKRGVAAVKTNREVWQRMAKDNAFSYDHPEHGHMVVAKLYAEQTHKKVYQVENLVKAGKLVGCWHEGRLYVRQ